MAKKSDAAPEGLPIKMLNDRILVEIAMAEGERKSSGGILIPATAKMSKRLTWAEVVGVGPNVRSIDPSALNRAKIVPSSVFPITMNRPSGSGRICPTPLLIKQ